MTAGNAPGLNDAAAALLIMEAGATRARGLKPLARIAGYAVAGTEPIDLFYAPVHSTRKLLKRLGMALSDFDLIEVNVHGGAIALGHPLGASGARLLTTLVWALRRHDKEWGLVTICMGGGLGLSLAVQRC